MDNFEVIFEETPVLLVKCGLIDPIIALARLNSPEANIIYAVSGVVVQLLEYYKVRLLSACNY